MKSNLVSTKIVKLKTPRSYSSGETVLTFNDLTFGFRKYKCTYSIHLQATKDARRTAYHILFLINGKVEEEIVNMTGMETGKFARHEKTINYKPKRLIKKLKCEIRIKKIWYSGDGAPEGTIRFMDETTYIEVDY